MTVEVWQGALRAMAILAVDPAAIGGVHLRARPGAQRDCLVDYLRALLPATAPVRKLPGHATEDRLLGGVDLASTLAEGRLVVERGLLSQAHGGVVVLPMAERVDPRNAAHLHGCLDRRELRVERDGVGRQETTRFGVVALDEGIDDERIPPSLAERLALVLDVDTVPPRWGEDFFDPPFDAEDVAAAANRRASVRVSEEMIAAFCKVACAVGIESLRAPTLALAVARSHAALEGREEVEAEDAEWAVRWVLAPRATQVPSEEEPPPPEDPPPPEEPPESKDDEPTETEMEGPIEDLLVAAAVSALPPGLLASLAIRGEQARGPSTSGPSGVLRRTLLRGRPIGSRRGELREGKLNVVETLRAAAPWQRLRRAPSGAKVAVRTEDFRIRRHQQRAESLTVFCVDASGSSALQRLGEAKGAVERVLAECYTRRDTVALVGFRGSEASLILPPTRSLVRAKRCLADLPGGGTTPLAAGIDAALEVARDGARRGQTPVLVVMTDGRANIRRDGTPDRNGAGEDALQSARRVQAEGVRALFVDTAPRPRPVARSLAEAMDARYLALPRTDADALTRSIKDPAGG